MKKYTNLLYVFLLVVLLTPQVSFAAFDKIKGLLRDFKALLDLIVPIVFGLAIIFFFWGLAQFIRSVSDKTITEGKNKMVWGIIALFVMISISGIIKYIGDSVGIDTGIKSSTSSSGNTSLPCIPGSDPADPTCGG